MNIKEHFQKNWPIWILVSITLVAFVIKSWDFKDQLIFELDQARDIRLIKNAYENGPGELPLLGPRAAGTFLRLGPAAYNIQYLSAVVVGKTSNIFEDIGRLEPWTVALPDLVLLTLSIPLFYYFLRQFFNRKISLLVVAIYASSFLITHHARFAWNPNQTPFWILLFMLGIYKSVYFKPHPRITRSQFSPLTKGRENEAATSSAEKDRRGWWLLVAAFAFGILSQLHFIALLAFPLIALVFWIFFRPQKIKIWFWLGAIAILIAIYVPVYLSETQTGWDNINQFRYALQIKGEEHGIVSKTVHSAKLHGMYTSFALSAFGNIENKIFLFGWIVFIGLSIWLGIKYYRNAKSASKEQKSLNDAKSKRKKHVFLVLMAIWFLVFFILYVQLAFEIYRSRFWLLNIFISFIGLGLIFQWLSEWKNKIAGNVITIAITLVLIMSNLLATFYWYGVIGNQVEGEKYKRNFSFLRENKIGIKQLNEAVALMAKKSEETDKTICFHANSELRSPVDYLIETNHPGTDFKRIAFRKDLNEQCIFFSVDVSHKRIEPKLPRDHQDKFEIIDRTDIGFLALWEVEKKEEWNRDLTIEEKEKKQQVEEEIEEIELSSGESTVEEPELVKPRRKDRVFWKDVI